MPTGVPTTTFNVNLVSGRATKPGTGNVTYLAPLDALAAVDANVVKKYQSSDSVATDHGTGSLLHNAAKVGVQNIREFRMGGFADTTPASPTTLTFGTATVGNDSGDAGAGPTGFDPIPTAVLPIYEITTAAIDGVNVSRIRYTSGDPTTATLVDTLNGEILVNPKTGAWKISRNTSGAGAGLVVTVKTANIAALKAQILMQPVEVVTFAGWRYNAQYFGAYDDLVAWAASNALVVRAAVDDSSDNTDEDFQDLIAGIRDDSFCVVAAKQTTPSDDLGSAYAALVAKTHPTGTLRLQSPPRGVTHARTLPYTFDEFGDGVDPSTGTFHDLGVNVVTLDSNTFVLSDDRCMTDYSAATDILFGGVRRGINATNALVAFNVKNTLTRSPTSALFDAEGMASVKSAIVTGLTQAVAARYIDATFTLRFPSLDDTVDTDRKRRVLEGVEYEIRVLNAIHIVRFNVVVSQ